MKNGKMRIDEDGNKLWYLNGKLHRIDGPAIEREDGSKIWLIYDQLHRTDGPDVETVDGYKEWYQNGKLHRIDGPAIERVDGYKEWWLNGYWYGYGHGNECLPPVDYTLAVLILEGISE